jgi:hypothetical protein
MNYHRSYERNLSKSMKWGCIIFMCFQATCGIAGYFLSRPKVYEIRTMMDYSPMRDGRIRRYSFKGLERKAIINSDGSVEIISTASLDPTKEPCSKSIVYSMDPKEPNKSWHDIKCEDRCFNTFKQVRGDGIEEEEAIMCPPLSQPTKYPVFESRFEVTPSRIKFFFDDHPTDDSDLWDNHLPTPFFTYALEGEHK